MSKELIFDEEARNALRKGVKELTSLVAVTLGPKGRHVGIDAAWGSPQLTNDGNTIVKEISLKNPYENMGAAMGKEVASKMKEHCGDGTTTSLLLLGALVEEGIKNIAAGASPILVKRGMDQAVEVILRQLEKKAKKIKGEIEEIATSSSDKSVGKWIASAFQKGGKKGVISIEESQTTETSLEVVEGLEFDRGYLSPYFSTDTQAMRCVLTNPKILITDKKISSVQEILPLLKQISSSGQELLIIAEDIEGDALSTLVVNRLRGTLKVSAVKAPGFGEQRKELLQDLSILTGATLVTEEVGLALKDVDGGVLGSCEKVEISKEKTTLIGGRGSNKGLQERIAQLTQQLETTEGDYEKKKLEERKAKLCGGVAVIRVGAATETELQQKKQLFEDSLNATKAALEEGIVTGGGIALLRAGIEVEKTLKFSNKEEEVGGHIAFRACKEPFFRLVTNSGYEGALFLEEILNQKEDVGFNVETGKIEDLFKGGIRDPLKVVKYGLKFAASTAGIILLSDCLVTETPEAP